MLEVEYQVSCGNMAGEFEKQLKQMKLEDSVKVLELINSAGKEFPCLSCESRDECGTFGWFLKWFGETAP
jgi:hypothetical protein